MSEDWFDEAWGISGNTLKQAQLTNLTFTIHSVQPLTFKDKESGESRDSYIATITIDGQDAKEEAWLGGRGVLGQIKACIEHDAFPVRVKQITEEKAYKLIRMDTAKSSIANGKANLMAFMKSRDLKAKDVLLLLNVKVEEGANVKAIWDQHIEGWKSAHQSTENEVYEYILSELESLGSGDELPFE